MIVDHLASPAVAGFSVSKIKGQGPASDQRGEHGAVGPVQTRPRVGSAEYSDLVAQDEDLDVLRRRCAAERREEAEEPNEDQVEETERHGRRSSLAAGSSIAAGSGLGRLLEPHKVDAVPSRRAGSAARHRMIIAQ